MRVFYDAELIERGSQLPLQPISFGFVAEDGSELYVINEECLSGVLRHAWLSVNVRPSLPIKEGASVHGSAGFVSTVEWDAADPEYANVLGLDALVQQVHSYLSKIPDLELWAYYGAYDHVALAQLFGDMASLPPGIPMWTHELMQEIETTQALFDGVELPPEPHIAHHALWDARWNRDTYNQLQAVKKTKNLADRR